MKPMLAKAADPAKLKFPLYAQPKLDGIRCIIVDGKALSRTLKLIPNKEIQDWLGRPELNGLDGELLVGSPRGESAYRDTTSFVMAPNKRGEDWRFYVFDKWDVPDIDYIGRMTLAADLAAAYDNLSFLGGQTVADPAALEKYEGETVAMGYEGVILRDPAGMYKFGRGSVTKGDLLKLKRYEDHEAEIIGVEEEMHNGNEAVTNALGRTERSTVKANKTGKGTLGALVVRGINGPAEGVEFKVGTGFDAATRQQLWNEWLTFGQGDRDGLVGKVVKYKSFPVGVKDKPRHPVFLGFRDMELDG